MKENNDRNNPTIHYNRITLLDGKTLLCYPKVEPTSPIDNRLQLDQTGKYLSIGNQRLAEAKPAPADVQQAKKFFTDHAFFFLDHRKQILNDSRMFLAPVPVQSGLAYMGTGGFNHPTLGVYVEWWTTCAPAIIGRFHNNTWLVYHIAGSPLSGSNCCGIVNPQGDCRSEHLPCPFSALWSPFIKINRRYDEAKEHCEAYSLEEVVKLLVDDDKGDSLIQRSSI